uniref:F-box domain-containing protein n=1 Tax=Caenorhabditis tropicalis TaxID=1561998 RepID=A0A1I7UAW2_9PELO
MFREDQEEKKEEKLEMLKKTFYSCQEKDDEEEEEEDDTINQMDCPVSINISQLPLKMFRRLVIDLNCSMSTVFRLCETTRNEPIRRRIWYHKLNRRIIKVFVEKRIKF